MLLLDALDGVSPSPWFDVDHYLVVNKDVARADIDPLLHFCKWGGLKVVPLHRNSIVSITCRTIQPWQS